MITMHPGDAMSRQGSVPGRVTATRPGPKKPATGRPALFVTMLALAALGVLTLLVVGPALPIPLAVLTAAALMGVVALAWLVAGPRL